MGDIIDYRENVFESIKKVNEYSFEFWYARDALNYTKWGNFIKVIDKAKVS